MLVFKKAYQLKLIALLLSILFLCNISLYCYAITDDTLRVPGNMDRNRIRETMDAISDESDTSVTPSEGYRGISFSKAQEVRRYSMAFFNLSGKFDCDMLNRMHLLFEGLTDDKKLEFTKGLFEILDVGAEGSVSTGEKGQEILGHVIAVEGATILDLSVEFDIGVSGELVPSRYMVRAGGAGTNAARVLNNLGSGDISVSLYGFSNEYQGNIFLEDLEQALTHITLQKVLLKGEAKTSLFAFVRDPDNPDAPPLELDMKPSNPKLTEAQGRELIGALSKLPESENYEFVIIGGQVFPGLQAERFYIPCIRMLEEKGYRVFVDFKPYMQVEEMMAVVEAHPEAIKANREEFARLAKGYFNQDFGDLKGEASISKIASMALTITQENGIGFFIVSIGELGIVVVYHDGLGEILKAVYIPAPEIERESSVASGDSLIGATVRRLILSRGENGRPDYIKAFIEGVAAGSATAEQPGTSVANAERTRALLEEMNSWPNGPVHFLDVKAFEYNRDSLLMQ